MPRTHCHENKFTWKQRHHALFRNPPSSQGFPTLWCFSFYLPCGSVVSQPLSASAERSGYLYTFGMQTQLIVTVPLFNFFLCSSRKHDSFLSSAKEGRLGLVLRWGSGLHLKLSIPDCFACDKHLPCPSHLMWLTGSLLLRGNLGRFISL